MESFEPVVIEHLLSVRVFTASLAVGDDKSNSKSRLMRFKVYPMMFCGLKKNLIFTKTRNTMITMYKSFGTTRTVNEQNVLEGSKAYIGLVQPYQYEGPRTYSVHGR